MNPAGTEIVLVDKSIMLTDTEVDKLESVWSSRKAHAPIARDKVKLCPNRESIEMDVFPPHGGLDYLDPDP